MVEEAFSKQSITKLCMSVFAQIKFWHWVTNQTNVLHTRYELRIYALLKHNTVSQQQREKTFFCRTHLHSLYNK